VRAAGSARRSIVGDIASTGATMRATLVTVTLLALLGVVQAASSCARCANGEHAGDADANASDPFALDLERFVPKVMRDHASYFPDVGTAERALAEYRRFLRLHQVAGPAREHQVAASKLVDLIWHEHVLDTKQYFADSERLFGRYLHHYHASSAMSGSSTTRRTWRRSTSRSSGRHRPVTSGAPSVPRPRAAVATPLGLTSHRHRHRRARRRYRRAQTATALLVRPRPPATRRCYATGLAALAIQDRHRRRARRHLHRRARVCPRRSGCTMG
jgi:hypothetical protein